MTSTAEITDRANIAPTTRARTSGRVMAIVSGCVLAGAMLTPAAASASSRGFVIHNQSTQALQLEAVKPVSMCLMGACPQLKFPIDFEGRPTVGAVLNPDRTQRFELKWRFSLFVYEVQYAANLWYKIGNTGHSAEYTITTSAFSNESGCVVHPATAGRCTAEGTKLTFQNG